MRHAIMKGRKEASVNHISGCSLSSVGKGGGHALASYSAARSIEGNVFAVRHPVRRNMQYNGGDGEGHGLSKTTHRGKTK